MLSLWCGQPRLVGWQANLYSLYKKDQRSEIPNQNPGLRHPG